MKNNNIQAHLAPKAVFPKVHVKIMHNQTMDFMDTNNILYDTPYGYIIDIACEHDIVKWIALILLSKYPSLYK